MSGQHIVVGSSDAWPEHGAQAERSLNTGWVLDQRSDGSGGFTVNCSPSSSGYIFTSTGDGSTGTGNGYYALGRAARVVQGASTIYGWIASASFSLGVTTVGLSSGTATAALSSGASLTSVAVGVETPQAPAASATPAATARFHREDGSWAAPIPLANCRVYNSANISLANNAWTTLTFDSERYDVGNMHSVVSNTGRITFPSAAKYIVRAQVEWASFSGVLGLRIMLNGLTEIAKAFNGGTETDGDIATEYSFAANDYVTIDVYQNSGAPINATVNANSAPEFMAHWIAA